MKPSVGRIVMAVGARARSNGTDVAAALITRVWSETDGVWTVNATVFPDNMPPQLITSAKLHTDEADARVLANAHENVTALHWPERVA